ncbi:hypothetical protein D3C85_1631080 [compost metagenome]
MTDMLVCRMLRGRPRIRDLSDRFDVPKSTLHDVLQAYRQLIEPERETAMGRLEVVMADAGIVASADTTLA